jgi:hypothetical protein
MKKFTLSVSEPCHENWDRMTPEQKGRFCAGCQKTVVDFTNMSDRQIAEFFKKTSGTTCGRFYSDQLNREIVVPKKRIPWLRYFFQITWPALMLFLKSCGQKDKTTGKIAVEERKAEEEMLMMGIAFPNITPVDTAITIMGKLPAPQCTMLVGDVQVKPSEIEDSIAIAQDDKREKKLVANDTATTMGDTTILPKTFVDTLKTDDSLATIVVGGFSVGNSKIMPSREVPLTQKPSIEAEQKAIGPMIFPNPIQRGQSLTVLNKQTINGVYQIVNLAGQVIQTGKLDLLGQQPFKITIQSWPSGTYILRMMDEGAKKSYTKKFIVQ